MRKVHSVFSRPKRSNKSHSRKRRNCLIQIVLDAAFQRGTVHGSVMSAVKNFCWGIVMAEATL